MYIFKPSLSLMIKILFSILFSLSINISFTQNVQFEWVKQISEVHWEKATSITVDNTGNVYTTGDFGHTIDFDPGPGVFNLSSPNRTSAFITKYNSAGNFIWAVKLEGVDVSGLSIRVDNYGNVYTAGHFYAPADFDPGPGVYNITNGSRNYFSKLDPSGNFIWAKGVGEGFTNITSMEIDGNGNVYSIGSFGVTMDFDPGPGSFTMSSFPGSTEIFILKLDTNGNFVWAKKLDETYNSDSEPGKIAIDLYDNVLITGVFGGTLDFDPGPNLYLLTNTSDNAFTIKLNTSGELVWCKHNESLYGTSHSMSIATDNFGNVYTGGVFWGGIDFDPSSQVYLISGFSDSYIQKLSPSGEFIWAKSIGDSILAQTRLVDIAVDNSNDVYATGTFYLTVDFDPGPGIFPLSAVTIGFKDIFILKLDNSGDFQWAKSIAGLKNDITYSIAIDNEKSVLTTGTFENIADFDPALPIVNLSSAGFGDIFIHKMSICTSSTYSNLMATSCNSYTLNNQTFTNSGIYTQIITNSIGCDSVITLNLTILSPSQTVTVSACDSYLWNGMIYSNSGNYIDTLVSSNGCDSIVTLQLTINQTSSINIDTAICQNENYEGYSTPGTYVDTLMSSHGCDSIRTLNLFIKENKHFLIDTSICPGTNYDGYSINGTYTDVYKSFNGCDSIRTLKLAIKNTCRPYVIPNTFTPNNDFKNDIFKPIIQVPLTAYYFIIYNRYGQKIFETWNQTEGWDGNYKGKEQPSGTYIYFLKYSTGNGYPYEEKGSFLLLK